MSTDKTPPRPWGVQEHTADAILVDAMGSFIAFVDADDVPSDRFATAQLIVTAVNAHEELVAACRSALLEAEADDRACVRDGPSQLTLQLRAALTAAGR